MLRVILINLLMLSLPLLLYVAYRYVILGEADGGEILRTAPIGWLAAAGAVLSGIVLISLLSFSDGHPGGRYIPPTTDKNGKIIPGHFEKVPPNVPKKQSTQGNDGAGK